MEKKAAKEMNEVFSDLLFKPMPVAPVRNRRCKTLHAFLGVTRSYLSLTCLIIITFITTVIVTVWYLNQKMALEEKCVAPPSVPSVVFENVTNTSLTVVWTYPNSSDASVHGYSVKLEDEKNQLLEKITTVDNEHTFRSLHPYTLYHVDVAAYRVHEECIENTMYSFKATASVVTTPGVPSVPGHHRVVNISSDSVEFTWEKPHIPNGPISGYLVTVQNSISSREVTVVETNFTARGLKPWTTYTFSISAFNKFNGSTLVGRKVTFPVKTIASIPSAPAKPRIGKVTNSSIEVLWDRPESPNGPIDGYTVECTSGDETLELKAVKTSVVFSKLKYYTKYTFTISAFNVLPSSTLVGPEAIVDGQTDGLPPPFPVKSLSVESTGQNYAKFSVPLDLFSNENGPIVEYVLLVAKSGYRELHNQRQGYDKVDQTHFQTWNSDPNDWYRASPKNWNFQTDCEDTYRRICKIGSDSYCSRQYCNGALNPGTAYLVKIRAYTDFGWTETDTKSFRTDPVYQRREYIPPPSYDNRRTSGFPLLKPSPGIVILFVSFILLSIFK